MGGKCGTVKKGQRGRSCDEMERRLDQVSSRAPKCGWLMTLGLWGWAGAMLECFEGVPNGHQGMPGPSCQPDPAPIQNRPHSSSCTAQSTFRPIKCLLQGGPCAQAASSPWQAQSKSATLQD